MNIKIVTLNITLSNKKTRQDLDHDNISPILKIFLSVIVLTTLLVFLNYNTNNNIIPAYAQGDNNIAINSPNINAKSIYDTGTAVLGNNVKNLIILIPDEAHHGNGEAKENRFIVQSFLPQTAVVNKGTKVIWFSGDVNHEHEIIINDNKGLFESGSLAQNSASNPMVFNTLGTFDYKSPNISQEAVKKGFVMKGKVVVVDQPNSLNSNSSSSSSSSSNTNNNNDETVGVYMVPAKDLDKYMQDFKDKGFSIDSTHTFTDVRGVARGTNSQQSLIVWTAGSSMTTDNVISALKDITPNLPYK